MMTNRLAHALSPYLRQHQDNPVDWRPWGDEAFAEAKRRKVPVFLSSGYAACHWCHVMAHESFENNDIAAFLNKHFINIKVDREERPDIDQIYMAALLRLQGHGGWPLSLFLTPDGKPFFGGTYFPPVPKYGQPGFLDVIKSVAAIWEKTPSTVLAHADELTKLLSEKHGPSPHQPAISFASLANKRHTLINYLDNRYGGLQGAPKFPQIPLWRWLFALATNTQDQPLLASCYLTACFLCNGGIFDHVDGGWMRYSTDESWLVPHFEKMLYDNAQIIYWLTELYCYRPMPLFHQRIQQTIDWLQRDMVTEHGVFASSLDADSEGVEGKYYVWTQQEINALLGDQAPYFSSLFSVSDTGNWEGKNILYKTPPDSMLENDEIITAGLELLRQARKKRIPPAQDNKILTSWNGLLIAAFAKAGIAFQRHDWVALATNTFNSLQKLLYHDEVWYHCALGNEYNKITLLEDWAAIIFAAIHLYCATGSLDYLEKSKQFIAKAEHLFKDSKNNLFYQSSPSFTTLITNLQIVQDSATPSDNGLMSMNYSLLGLLTGNESYFQSATALNAVIGQSSSNHPYFLSGLAWATGLLEKGATIKSDFFLLPSEMKNMLFSHLPPYAILIQASKKTDIEVCFERSCLPPASDATTLEKILKDLYAKQYA